MRLHRHSQLGLYPGATARRDVAAAKINTVLGYPGGAEIDLAVEKGEVVCRGMTASPFFGREPFLSWRKKNFVRLLLFSGDKRDERIPDVPTIFEIFDKENVTPSSRRVADVILAAEKFGRPIIAGPGIAPTMCGPCAAPSTNL